MTPTAPDAPTNPAASSPINEFTSHVVVLFPHGMVAPVQIATNLADPLQVLTTVNQILAGYHEPAILSPKITIQIDTPHQENNPNGPAGYVILHFARAGTCDATLHVGNLPWDLVRAGLELMRVSAEQETHQMVARLREEAAASAPKIFVPSALTLNGKH